MLQDIILGVDPGTRVMGFGIIKIIDKNPCFVCLDELILHKIDNPYLKLKSIFEKTNSLITQYKPQSIALESPFFFKNIQSTLKLGRAQAVAITAALQYDLDVFEYSPTKIKTAVCSNGRASKEQIAKTVCQLLKIDTPKNRDVTDALAVALCHFYQAPIILEEKKYQNWKSFIQNKSLL